MPEPSPWALEGWRHTTLMTMLQAATCVAPGRFEHSAALTTWEPLPTLANVALNFRQGGQAVLGHLISPEIGEVRRAQVRLTEDQLFPHWLVAADTRFGKTVLAQRIVYEMLLHHRCRVIACDFAAGWRDLIGVLGFTTQPVEYGSLYPGAARPLHFNCLRVGPNIDAASTLAALVDLTAMAGRFGERQYGFLHQTLRDVYLENGVLTEDDWVLDDLVVIPEPKEVENGKPKGPVYRAPRQGQDRWGWLRTTEKALINARRRARGEDDLPNKPVRLLDLHPDPLTARADRHAIAAYRSRRVDVRRWVERLTQLRDSFKRLPTSFDSIQGILNRLQLLAEGELGRMLGAGDDSLTIEELAWPQGLAVIEAGEGEALSAFTKSLLFSIIAWRIYTDAVKRWQQANMRGERVPHTVIVLEEANKIYGSVEAGSANQTDAPHHSDLFPKMHRDAGKYDLTFINNLQSPGEIPLPIVTSSNNVAISKLQGDVDAKVALAALGFSPHGLHDLRLYHLLTGKIAQAQFVVKLGLHTDRTQIAPFLMRPLRLALAPVTDRDILKQFTY